jgi:hypothetical protein
MTPGRTRWLATAALLLLLAPAPLLAQDAATCPDRAALTAGFSQPLADVRYLADDALQGREVGSPGARCAAEYIAQRFRSLGLSPAGPDGSWFQAFPVRTGTELGPDNVLAISGRTYATGKEWIPFGFSATSTVRAALVYAGSGLSSPGQARDALAQVDLSGKIAVVDWGDPDAMAGGSSQRDDPHFKATVAAGRHAAALVVLLPDGMSLPSPAEEIRSALSIPVVAVAGGAAAESVRQAAQHDRNARVSVEVLPVTAQARNVVAQLPGADPSLSAQHVVVGAHFDHLGLGGEGSGSLAPDSHEIHNGADDNASGTAGLLDVAGRLAGGARPARSVLFIAFTGEERGLWGSARFVAHPTVELSSIVAMLNLDMIGRMTDDAVTVFGTGTAEEWDGILAAENDSMAHPLHLSFNPDGYGSSDQTSFYAQGIPVLHFFTNTHADYHRPTDDWWKINAEGLDEISNLAARITERLAGAAGTEPAELTPVQQQRPSARGDASPTRSYGPYLGTIPDMTPRDFGLRITGVREGSPAEKAGLRAGDVIVEFDGKEIPDLYAYAYALREKKPGDEVTIVVERDGQNVSLKAVLGSR